MNIVKASVRIPQDQLNREMLNRIERCARICYKSEEKMQDAAHSSESFLRSIMKSGHESVIEHEKITLMFITDRGVTHEVVRHRLGSYSQESTRYCNYNKEKFGSEITVIAPCFYTEDDPRYALWQKGCLDAEANYFAMLDAGGKKRTAQVTQNRECGDVQLAAVAPFSDASSGQQRPSASQGTGHSSSHHIAGGAA